MSLSSKVDRIHTFDNLRAIIALLGIPFHVAFFLCIIPLMKKGGSFFQHGVFIFPSQYYAHDTIFLLIFYLHTFRIPVFFLLAGFFSHLLCEQKGMRHFVKNRVTRIVPPFIFFILLMLPFSLAPVFLMALQEQEPVSQLILLKYNDGSLWRYLNNTWSYWFLYDLLWFYLMGMLLLFLTHRRFKMQKLRLFFREKMNFLLSGYWIYFVLFFMSIGLLILAKAWYGPWYKRFQPSISILLFYGMWYFLGWHLWRKRNALGHLVLNPWKKFTLSFVVYLLYLILYHYFFKSNNELMYFFTLCFYCLSMILGVFACLGVAERYFSTYQPIMKYFVDASYWIYLMQVPILFVLTPFLLSTETSIYEQFMLGNIVCLAICVGSYQLLVRHTWLRAIIG